MPRDGAIIFGDLIDKLRISTSGANSPDPAQDSQASIKRPLGTGRPFSWVTCAAALSPFRRLLTLLDTFDSRAWHLRNVTAAIVNVSGSVHRFGAFARLYPGNLTHEKEGPT